MIKFKTHYGRQIVTIGGEMHCFDTLKEAWRFIFRINSKRGGMKHGV